MNTNNIPIRLLTFMLVLVLSRIFTSVPLTHAENNNLLTNASFELFTGGAFTGWISSDVFTSAAVTGRTGYAASITGRGQPWAGLQQNVSMTGTLAQTQFFEVSAYVKAGSGVVGEKAAVNMEGRKSDGSKITPTNVNFSSAQVEINSTDWVKISAVFDGSKITAAQAADMAFLKVYVNTAGKGDIIIDDFELKTVSSPTPSPSPSPSVTPSPSPSPSLTPSPSASPSATPSADANVIRNPGVETGDLTNWGTYGNGAPTPHNWSVTAEEKHSGNYAIQSVSGTNPGTQINQTNLVVTPGKWYVFSFYAKISASGLAKVRNQGDGATVTGSKELSFTANQAWTKYKIEFQAPAEGQVKIYLNESGTGTNYFDDFELILKPDPIAMVSTSVSNNSTDVALTDTITLTFNNGVDAATLNTDNIKLNGAVITGISLDSNTQKIVTLTLSARLEPQTNYRLVLKGIADVFSDILAETTISFTTAPAYQVKNNISYSGAAVDGNGVITAGGTITASVEIRNNSLQPKPVSMIVTIYDTQGVLRKIGYSNEVIGSDSESTLHVTLQATAGQMIRCYVWDDLIDMNSIVSK